jgi:hypothetical protein
MADGNRPMNDQSIDGALREALDVSPSPDFVARVRTRIANEPAPHSVWNRWIVWMPVAVAAAAALALAAWLTKPAEIRHMPDTMAAAIVPPQPAPTVRLKADTTTPTTETTATAVKNVVSGFPSTTPGAGGRTVRVRNEPEILISQSESAALRRLMVRASEAPIVVNDSPWSASDSGPDPSHAVQPLLEIQPLKIDPIVPVDGQEGVRQ